MALAQVAKTVYNSGSSTGTSFTCPSFNATGANFIFVVVFTQGGALSNISDSNGNTYTLVGSFVSSANYYLYQCYGGTFSTQTITVTTSGIARCTFAPFSYSGADSTPLYDSEVGSASGTTSNTVSLTTTKANDIGFMFLLGQNITSVSYGSGQTTELTSDGAIVDMHGSSKTIASITTDVQTINHGFAINLIKMGFVLSASAGTPPPATPWKTKIGGSLVDVNVKTKVGGSIVDVTTNYL